MGALLPLPLFMREDEVLEEVPQVGKEVEVEDKKSSRV